jgi:hypothetical protein
MLAAPSLSSGCMAHLVIHHTNGPWDKQLAVRSLPTHDQDPTKLANKRTRQRRELRYRNRQKMANLQSSAHRDEADQPAAPAQESHQTRSDDLLPATVTRSSEDDYALLIEESKHFSEKEVQIESSRRVYMASPLRVPSQNYTRKKKKKKSTSPRVSRSSSNEPASRLRRDEGRLIGKSTPCSCRQTASEMPMPLPPLAVVQCVTTSEKIS